ncbi:MAG: ABC transporter ATP-binding protein [Gammaproteobacteria bacterium RIFCSPLOWO2_02_FULL_61_13]|nr:MAG: ABC transporter ATP-binding protein [Gammaproteobacteria bacterium RIFCSPLOWO2_02_FULL_61_13]
MLSFTDVGRRFGAVNAVDGVTLVVPSGTTTVLIGPSGCGKSTLLRLATGLEKPDRGVVCFHDEPLGAETLPRLRQRMGYVIQDGGLFPHLTGAENVTLMARYLGWGAGRITARQALLADLVQLHSDQLNRYPLELSGGQRQRVCLMRALMLDPDLLLLDEPLAALDPLIRVDLQEVLRRIFTTLGKTVLLVTHDLAEAAYFAGQIVLLRAGRVVQQGAVRELLEQPAEPFVEQFVKAQREPLRLLAEAIT